MRVCLFLFGPSCDRISPAAASSARSSGGASNLIGPAGGNQFFSANGPWLFPAWPNFSGVTGGQVTLSASNLFWFLGRIPRLYVLILPAMGIVLRNPGQSTRAGRSTVTKAARLFRARGWVSCQFIVWGHHMFLTGMGVKVSAVL